MTRILFDCCKFVTVKISTFSLFPTSGCFPIEWISRKDVFFNETNNLLNPWNEGKQIKISREGQEIEPGVGERLLALFTGHSTG